MFKIFSSYMVGGVYTVTAADSLNSWLEENPDVTIIDWQFQQTDQPSMNSICIEYEKTKKVIEDVAK